MKKVFVIFGSLIAFFLVEKLVMIPLTPSLHRWVDGNVVKSLLVQGVIEAIMLILFILLNLKFFKQKILFARYNLFKGFGLMWYTWLTLFSVLVVALGGNAMKSQIPGASPTHLTPALVVTALVVTLLVGFAEELIFRGMILGTLISKGKSLWFSISVSSILFGLIHLVNLSGNSLQNVVLQVLYVIPMGVFLAVLYV